MFHLTVTSSWRSPTIRRLAQTVPAQAVAAFDRHRQLCGFLRAPAGAGKIAAEFRSAAGTNKTAWAGLS
jgi:hypothetical protein